MPGDPVSLSKFLSYVLRHRPGSIGVTLDEHGWVAVDELLARAAAVGRILDRATLGAIVAADDKQRFTLSEDGNRIRAAQGHSIDVELGLEPVVPPETLYHGTATRFLDAIRAEGLRPGGRRHVHLSADEATAVAVGKRHGKPVVLRVAAGEMHRQGHVFHRADNGVWLTRVVPPVFLA
ncbi:MAG: RNA 2'-phosphotransferase [Planctomycetota bacterium]